MSPRLKPLLLPQLVEEKRKLELLQAENGEHTLIYYPHSSSTSDLTSPSPATPGFSRTHSRYSSSASSLASSSSDSPSSPSQPTHTAGKNSKSQLPDVQEDPSEREEEDHTVVPDCLGPETGLYDCLCDEACVHQAELAHSTTIYPYSSTEFDYDLGFLSDTDFNGSPRQKKRRHGSDAGFSSWGTRLGSRLPSLPRWRSSRRNNFAFFPGSDPALDQPSNFSRAASSRSSSISVPARGATERSLEPPLPATPALSFYESLESLPSPLEISQAQVAAGKTIERDRALATTPLLPPLMTEAPPARSLQPSPLQSPTVAPGSAVEAPHNLHTYPTPPLSTKASVSSFRRGTVSSTYSDIPSPLPCLLDHQDAWSDRLGHANFTIEPRPYTPEQADLATIQSFRADWDLARINYMRHLVRTGEHYGTTSKTYALTEAKWAEIEQKWHRIEGDLIQRLDPQGCGSALATLHLRRITEISGAIPRMLSDDAKFPERGDVDIVGPMVRDAVMIREGQDERRSSASGWLKQLADKVKLRK
ncbi:hypothetical protein QBC47DRAFT_291275 [Echria macrotheca]|uniref:Only prolin and serin are matching in the corresponding protein n=1 Tax=Echria macrotheca TaxID=438768 RepID=A0AAJ0BKV1_9PEZI|nr:hypothetical protein QBC47DRAFT_291275 [Echria macrotheca]